jgi:predicted nucleic acid-binding protein
MIIVDTNVIFECLKPGRNSVVVNWLDAQIVETLYFTAVSLSELRLGIETLPAGKRKETLGVDVNALIANFFSSRILSFDREAALSYGALVGATRAKGRAVSVTDGQIAAIARVHGFAVATRDTKPFIALGVPIINPWQGQI